jgi:hypothetical protein
MLTTIACTYCSLKHNSNVTRTELYSDDVLKYSNVSKTLNNSYCLCFEREHNAQYKYAKCHVFGRLCFTRELFCDAAISV